MIPREDGFEIFIYYANIVLFDPMFFYFYLLIRLFPLFHFALQHLVLFNSASEFCFAVTILFVFSNYADNGSKSESERK